MSGMRVARTAQEFRKMKMCKLDEFARPQKTVLVPTMGSLHSGHLSLIELGKSHVGEDGLVAASVFVNPGQFAPHEDFEKYPRDLDHDLELLESKGVDLVFAPTTGDVYPVTQSSSIQGDEYTNSQQIGMDFTTVNDPMFDILEGAARPGFFRGVATVVSILFNVVQPDFAVFGQKDYQQVAVVNKMIRDLHFPIELITAPIQREQNGLAMSSRNEYLKPEEKESAGVIFKALSQAKEMFEEDGVVDALEIRSTIESTLKDMEIDYVSIADRFSLRELKVIDQQQGAVVSLAVFHGEKRTRLIDNVELL
eukprot:TRINITY_DN1462_c0_g1_i1.p1 TRINITY_DN1462_c0_g1~~TRINITY_DN1462_c0_g1_i1.p1  ORF type:complete len:309 (+),score=96.92 TRINITY_DN1462_c0_g1_i1:63-989(+)